jgi:hypothetical protein
MESNVDRPHDHALIGGALEGNQLQAGDGEDER